MILTAVSVSHAKPGFGFKGGINLAGVTLDPDYGIDVSRKVGVMLGGVGEVSLNDKNTLIGRGSVLYVQKGWKEEGLVLIDGDLYDYEGTASIEELVLAPSLCVRFPSQSMTPFIVGGLELGMNLSAKGEIEIEGFSGEDDFEDWSSTNLGLNIGAGAVVPSGKGEIVLEISYNLGLSNMYTGDEDGSTKTNGIQLSVGYLFSSPTK